jgi:hypothetical protein
MDTVTYPDTRVEAALAADFRPLRLNLAQADGPAQGLAREFRVLWTPTLVFLEPHRIEVRRTVGFLPPDEFLAELGMARGMAALLRADYAEAFVRFRAVAEAPITSAAPEALYWAGVAGYRRDGTRDELHRQWRQLRDRFPDSGWWTRASFASL